MTCIAIVLGIEAAALLVLFGAYLRWARRLGPFDYRPRR